MADLGAVGTAAGYYGSADTRLDVSTRLAGFPPGAIRSTSGTAAGYYGSADTRLDITSRLAGIPAPPPAGSVTYLAGSMTDALEVDIINHTLRNTSFAAAPAYLALYTATPSDAGGGTECADVNYARQSVTFAAPSTPAGTSSNANVIEFPAAAASFVVVAIGIWTALSGGRLNYWKLLNSQLSISAGDFVRYNIGQLEIQIG